MKSILLSALAIGILVASVGVAAARGVRIWPYQELFEKSDLVVIATPTDTSDTQEHIDLPGFNGEHVIGLETRFSISTVLKGDKSVKNFILHHYRTSDGTNIPHVVNGPTFVSFTSVQNPASIPQAYLLFLAREADGRYAPVVGQTDPGLAIKELVSVGK